MSEDNGYGYIRAFEMTFNLRGMTSVNNSLGFHKERPGYLGGTFEATDHDDLFLVRLYFKRMRTEHTAREFTHMDLPKSVRRIRIPLVMATAMGIGGE